MKPFDKNHPKYNGLGPITVETRRVTTIFISLPSERDDVLEGQGTQEQFITIDVDSIESAVRAVDANWRAFWNAHVRGHHG